MPPKKHSEDIPLFIPRSIRSSAENKTGSWRYFRPRYEEKTAPCSAACPVGEDIPRIELLVRQGLIQKAWEAILEENPFPSICGRVCFHPCETACNRGDFDQPIAIHRLERLIGDHALNQGKKSNLPPLAARGKKIAIAGAGPAGLAAAYFMNRLGFNCEIFEAAAAPGGLLRWGIPVYRLPEDILNREIARIEDQGVKIHCRTPVTPDFLEKLQARFDAVFIGCGFSRPIRMNIPGEELAQDGLSLLYQIRDGQSAPITGRAAVVGGGNTAVDVARSLKRLGATPIIVYRRRKADMPAFEPEIEMALEEGIELRELVAPIAIGKDGGGSAAKDSGYTMTLQKMKVSATEIRGRARVAPDGDKTEIVAVDQIYMAIGAGPEAMWDGPQKHDDDQIALSHCRFMEQAVPLIIGGDLTNDNLSVSDAIASGKQAAMALDVYFNKGLAAIAERLKDHRIGNGASLCMTTYLDGEARHRNPHVVTFAEINCDYFQSGARAVPARLTPRERMRSFDEIETTLKKDAAVGEAERCFNCGICTACDYCRIFCPEVAVVVEKAHRHINMDYCKGCGICVTECPRNAMALEEEKK
ncbi:MAG: FAD-dependent oxidoreductase [Deltaproteobacteria bacterium]|jgi:NADPH-dependent glutamate synthase beta subunit-like oxidoreductase|nr:FAD-dependent oxidoreductase [Deltaproteobacteria bacterium]